MTPRQSWKICKLMTTKHLQRGDLLRDLAGNDDYPREANWVHLLATTLETGGRQVLLESPYWRAYKPRKSAGWPKADLWINSTDNAPETWVEVKIAELHEGTTLKIGTERATKILELWANDIWRLLVCTAEPNKDAEYRCGFVVYTWGRTITPPPSKAVKRPPTNADTFYESLLDASRKDDPVIAFLDQCAEHFDVTVHGSGQIQAIVVEWTQTRPPRAHNVEKWGSRTRSLV
jgi:hypothetical protein